MLDFKIKARPCHIANVDNGKNPKFLAINHNTISFERETYRGNKKIPTRLTIIRPLAAGWGAAPYKQNQKGVRTSRLSEFSQTQDNGPVVKFYSFEKASSNLEKGPRCDDITFELMTGNALNLWMDEKRLEEMRKMLPEGLARIEPFTLCEIQVAPKNKEGAAKGSACKIVEVRPVQFTLYSCIQDIERLQSSAADARAALLKHQQSQQFIANDLITNEPAFHIHASHKAFIHEDPDGPKDTGLITIVNTGIEPIDIPLHTLLAYTNSADRNQACSLLEMAIATSSLQMLVINNDYWKNATQSAFRGIPIINTELLLQSVIPARIGDQTCFPTPHIAEVDEVVYNVQIHVEQVICPFFTIRIIIHTHKHTTRNPPPSPPASRPRPRTSSSPERTSSSSAPTRSASTSPTPKGARSPATGSGTTTPRPARAPRLSATSAARPPRARMMGRTMSERAQSKADEKVFY